MKKEANKAQKLGLATKGNPKLTRIPNLYPYKKEILEEQELTKAIALLEKKKKSEVTVKDLEDMIVQQDDYKIQEPLKEEKEGHKQNLKSKNEFKRDLNLLVQKCDVIIEVIDVRDPIAYRSKELENNVRSNKDKKLIIVLNKTDLVEKYFIFLNYSNVSDQWARYFRRDCPTLVCSTKNENNFLDELVDLIKNMIKDSSKKILVGVVGYPNTGKTSIINMLRLKSKNPTFKDVKNKNLIFKVTLDNNIKLLSSFGVLFSKNEVGPLMPKSSKNPSDLKNPLDALKTLLDIIPHDDLLEMYEISDFENLVEFLENIAKKNKFLIKVIIF